MKLPPEPLTPDEVAALVAAAGRSPSGIRNRALIQTLYWTGVRISEALALYPRDIDPLVLRVRHGKGGRHRTVNLPAAAGEALAHWLTVRDAYANGRHPVFCQITRGREGGAIQTAYVRAMLPRLAARAGIEKRVHAHGLRHSCAIRLAQAGFAFTDIQVQLGHESAATTARYLRTLGADAALERLQALDR